MSEVKRYGYDSILGMIEAENGVNPEWIKASDYEALQQDLRGSSLVSIDRLDRIIELQQKLDDAEATIKRKDKDYQHLIEQHMPRTGDGCEKGWSRVIEATELQQKLDAMTTERDNLRKFFEAGIRQAFDGCHFDGGEMQNLAVQLGLLREETYDTEKHRDLVPDPSAFVAGDPVYFIV